MSATQVLDQVKNDLNTKADALAADTNATKEQVVTAFKGGVDHLHEVGTTLVTDAETQRDAALSRYDNFVNKMHTYLTTHPKQVMIAGIVTVAILIGGFCLFGYLAFPGK